MEDVEGFLECEDCAARVNLFLISADLGEGAFLKVLCETCWHRRKYRAELEERRRDRALVK